MEDLRIKKLIFIRVIYLIIALLFLFIGFKAIQRLEIKADLPFDYISGNDGKILIENTSLEGSSLLSIDGKYLSSKFKIELYLDSKSIGDKVNLSINSQNRIVSTEIELVPFYKDNLFIIISSLVGLFFWLTALFVIIKKVELNEARILFWILTFFALAIVTSPGKYYLTNDIIGHFIRIVHGLSYLFGISSFLHFIVIFPFKSQGKRIFFPIIYFFVFLFSALVSISIYLSTTKQIEEWILRYDYLWDILQGFLVVSIVSGTVFLYIKYRGFTKKEDKQKILWVLWGNIVGVSPFILLYIIPYLFYHKSIVREEFLLAFLIFIPIAFSVAVIKYHVFEIDIVVKRSLLYTIMTTFVLILYFGIVGIVVFISKGLIDESDKVLTLIVIFIIVAIFNPIRLWVNKVINKLFFRVKYDFEKDINIFSASLKEASTLKELCELIIGEILKLIPVKKIAIALRTEYSGRLKIPVQNNFDEMSKNISALRIFQIHSDFKNPLGLREKIDGEVKIDEIMQPVLKKWEINIVIPLEIEKDIVVGAFILGDKLSGQRYSLKETEILNLIAVQSVFAIHRLQLQEKLIEEEIEMEKIEELSKLKSEFVSSVSHELQTPLTSIQMFAETLSSDRIITDAKKKEYLQIIQGECGRLTRLISGILDFSKIEKGIKKYQFTEVNLTNLLKNICNSVEFQCSKKNIKMNTELPEKNVLVCGDNDAISEAILNLLSNAIKYSGISDTIYTRLYKEKKFAFVSIKDNGIGIEENELKHIFDSYFRSQNEAASYKTGTGLGLTITKHIMDAHEGEIEVHSELGKGSEFILKFPLQN